MLALVLVLTAASPQLSEPSRSAHLLAPPPIAPPLVPASTDDDTQVSAQQLREDIRGLLRLRPSLTVGIVLTAVGGAGVVLLGLGLALSSLSSMLVLGSPLGVLSAVGLAVSSAFTLFGAWQLALRFETRARIDAEIDKLKAELRRRPAETPAPQPPLAIPVTLATF